MGENGGNGGAGGMGKTKIVNVNSLHHSIEVQKTCSTVCFFLHVLLPFITFKDEKQRSTSQEVAGTAKRRRAMVVKEFQTKCNTNCIFGVLGQNFPQFPIKHLQIIPFFHSSPFLLFFPISRIVYS